MNRQVSSLLIIFQLLSNPYGSANNTAVQDLLRNEQIPNLSSGSRNWFGAFNLTQSPPNYQINHFPMNTSLETQISKLTLGKERLIKDTILTKYPTKMKIFTQAIQPQFQLQCLGLTLTLMNLCIPLALNSYSNQQQHIFQQMERQLKQKEEVLLTCKQYFEELNNILSFLYEYEYRQIDSTFFSHIERAQFLSRNGAMAIYSQVQLERSSQRLESPPLLRNNSQEFQLRPIQCKRTLDIKQESGRQSSNHIPYEESKTETTTIQEGKQSSLNPAVAPPNLLVKSDAKEEEQIQLQQVNLNEGQVEEKGEDVEEEKESSVESEDSSDEDYDGDSYRTKKTYKKGKQTVVKARIGNQRALMFKKELKSKSIYKDKFRQNSDKENSLGSKFVCPKCNENYVSGQALGGHMSRVHPGSSDAYNAKIQRRKERRNDRILLDLAKKKFYSEVGKGVPIDRVKIRRYKKELRRQIEKGILQIPTEN